MWSGQWKHQCTSDSLGECIENLVLRRKGSMDRSRAAQMKSPGASILFPKHPQCIDFIPQGASIFVSTEYSQLRDFVSEISRGVAPFLKISNSPVPSILLMMIVMIIPATLASTYLKHRFTYLVYVTSLYVTIYIYKYRM